MKSGDKKLAAELLEKALKFLLQPVETRDEYEAMIRIIHNSMGVDRERSFEMFGSLIDPINNDPLKAMGMGVAFARGKADFSGMLDQNNLYISEVKQKAVVEVNEEGTVAAAATSVGVMLVMAIQRFTFIADHPFLMMIRDQRTDALLFIGVRRLVVPKRAEKTHPETSASPACQSLRDDLRGSGIELPRVC